jgi:hypothetical protein
MNSSIIEKGTGFTVAPPQPPSTTEKRLQHKTKPVAIFVAHGMGQQVPFETLNSIAEGLMTFVSPSGSGRQARTITSEGETLQRLELDLTLDGDKRQVHVYEAYWAPLTEGAVGIIDVLRLLFSAGTNGLKCASSHFVRSVFGTRQTYITPRADIILLLTALATVASLLVLNGVVAAVVAARFAFQQVPWLTDALLRDLTTLFEWLLLISLLFGGFLFASIKWRGARARLKPLLVSLFALTLVLIITSGLVMAPVLFYCHHDSGRSTPFLPRVTRTLVIAPALFYSQLCGSNSLPVGLAGYLEDSWSPRRGVLILFAVLVVAFAVLRLGRLLCSGSSDADKVGRWIVLGGLAFFLFLPLLAWYLLSRWSPAHPAGQTVEWSIVFALLAGLSAYVRSFLIQYLGDVAAYVQSHTLDRFFDIRARIKEKVWKSMHAVYALRDGGQELYDDILLVGHSLGSVIVYDTLNRIINDDELTPDSSVSARTRTQLLLTFGSPLDKVAFIFHVQSKGQGGDALEALAAAKQPLITSTHRPRWINVWSPADIISGPLDFFDQPDKRNANPVCNVVDPEAATLLAAHTQYWKNSLIYQILRDGVFGKYDRRECAKKRRGGSVDDGPSSSGRRGKGDS